MRREGYAIKFTGSLVSRKRVGTLCGSPEPSRRNQPKAKELRLVFHLSTGGGESGCMTLFDHAALHEVRRSLGFAGDQVVDQQLDRIERFRAAAVQPERDVTRLKEQITAQNSRSVLQPFDYDSGKELLTLTGAQPRGYDCGLFPGQTVVPALAIFLR